MLALSALLIVLDSRNSLDSPKGLSGEIITPLTNAVSNLGERVRGVRSSDSELQSELDEIKTQRDTLLAENARLYELVAEVDQLREQLDFQHTRPELEILSANVISRDPLSLEKFIVIDRGSDQGVEVGMAVVSPQFLIGQVVEVDPGRSRVLLLIDNGFQTGAQLQISRGAGVLYGRWQSGGRAEMRHVPLDTDVVSQELVVTSGVTEGIPEGLIIGQIEDLHRDELGNEITISVIPLVDFDDLQTVSVILGEVESQQDP